MIEKFFEFAAEYGPFPGGIIVGVWINRWASSKAFAFLDRELKYAQKERDKLFDTLKNQELRLDKLHDMLDH